MRLIAGLLLILLASSLHADPLPEDRDWHAFIQEGTTNIDMQMQASRAIAILNARLANVVNEISVDLDEEAKALLTRNQAAWTEAAKSKCAFLADSYRGGSHQGLAYGYAYVEEQLKRIRELREMRRYRDEP